MGHRTGKPKYGNGPSLELKPKFFAVDRLCAAVAAIGRQKAACAFPALEVA
jgi:hypothetical protein